MTALAGVELESLVSEPDALIDFAFAINISTIHVCMTQPVLTIFNHKYFEIIDCLW